MHIWGRKLTRGSRLHHPCARGETAGLAGHFTGVPNDRAKAFYQRWDFSEMPGQPYRLFLSSQTLTAMMNTPIK
jgi:hypothetical protein